MKNTDVPMADKLNFGNSDAGVRSGIYVDIFPIK
jgi:hypothetical protein